MPSLTASIDPRQALGNRAKIGYTTPMHWLTFYLVFACLLNPFAARAQSPCDVDLGVTTRTVHRMTGSARVYEFRHDPGTQVRLEVTLTETTLGQLNELGVNRRSRAARALGFTGPLESQLSRPVRVAYLQFQPPRAQAVRHHEHPPQGRSVRDEHRADFEAREALIKEMMKDLGDRNTAYAVSFNGEALLWREFEELAYHGLSRFAARSWIAGVMRPLGAHGAVVLNGSLPPEVGAPPRGPYYYSLALARQNGWGPQILLFQRVRPAPPVRSAPR